MDTPRQPVEVLLVEDNPSDVELILQVFEWFKMSKHVKVAWDGAEAVDFLYGTGTYAGVGSPIKPKVVILDLKLPKMNGVEVLRKIKSDDRTRTIPVVVLTSSREDCDMVESYNLGANSYIVKPVNFDDFSSTIRDLGHYWGFINEPLEIPPNGNGIPK